MLFALWRHAGRSLRDPRSALWQPQAAARGKYEYKGVRGKQGRGRATSSRATHPRKPISPSCSTSHKRLLWPLPHSSVSWRRVMIRRGSETHARSAAACLVCVIISFTSQPCLACPCYPLLRSACLLLARAVHVCFGLVWFKYRAPVPKLPRHLPLDGGSLPAPGCITPPRVQAVCVSATRASLRLPRLLCLHDTPREHYHALARLRFRRSAVDRGCKRGMAQKWAEVSGP